MDSQEQKKDLHAVIRFKRDCTFPRFSMSAGERWGFAVGKGNRARLDAIKTGQRFDFAGGQCLAEDVELIYEGPGNLAYSIAAGYVTNPDVIKSYRENPARFEPKGLDEDVPAESQETPQRRIVATFPDQALFRDTPQDRADVTTRLLAYDLEAVHRLRDDSKWASLLVNPKDGDRCGPDLVKVEQSICAFFGVSDIGNVTQTMLDEAALQAKVKRAFLVEVDYRTASGGGTKRFPQLVATDEDQAIKAAHDNVRGLRGVLGINGGTCNEIAVAGKQLTASKKPKSTSLGM